MTMGIFSSASIIVAAGRRRTLQTTRLFLANGRRTIEKRVVRRSDYNYRRCFSLTTEKNAVTTADHLHYNNKHDEDNDKNNATIISSSSTTRTTTTNGGVANTTTTTTNNDAVCMPFSDEKMPFYALGMTLALQIRGGGHRHDDLKKMLKGSEIDIMLEGFADTFRGDGRSSLLSSSSSPRDDDDDVDGENEGGDDEKRKRSSDNAKETTTPLSLPDDFQAVVQKKYGKALQTALQKRHNSMIESVRKEGKEYLENYLKKTTNSSGKKATTTARLLKGKVGGGVVYCERVAGTGRRAAEDTMLEIHYRGTLPDGTVFDSSVVSDDDREGEGKAKTVWFHKNAMILGLQAAIVEMKEGGVATIIVPPERAYGIPKAGEPLLSPGGGPKIPPGSTLIFDIELFTVVDAKDFKYEDQSTYHQSSSSSSPAATQQHEKNQIKQN